MPFARATGIGSTAACADHSKSVCRRQRSTISSPVMVSVMVVMETVMLPKSQPFDKRATQRFYRPHQNPEPWRQVYNKASTVVVTAPGSDLVITTDKRQTPARRRACSAARHQ